MSETQHPGRRWRWTPGVVLFLLLIGGVMLLVFLNQRPEVAPPVAPIERLRSQLELRDGRLFDQEVPFSGSVIDRYESGMLKSRSAVVNGYLEGLSEGWHTNGLLQVQEHFVHGISHGNRLKFYSSGKRLSEAPIVNGEITGWYERWHENGVLAERVYLTNGVPDGESLAFHPDGSLKARVNLDQGIVLHQQFWSAGEMPAPPSGVTSHN